MILQGSGQSLSDNVRGRMRPVTPDGREDQAAAHPEPRLAFSQGRPGLLSLLASAARGFADDVGSQRGGC